MARERLGIPRRGLGYGCLRYLHPDGELREALGRRGQARAIFNYLGRIDAAIGDTSPFEVMEEPVGAAVAPDSTLTHPLAFTGCVRAGCLQLRLDHADTLSQSSARRLLEDLTEFIQRVASELRAGGLGLQYVPRGVSSPELELALAAVSYEGDHHGE